MRAAGVCVHLPKKGRPVATVVVADQSWDDPRPADAFELTSKHADLAPVLCDLAIGLRSRLSGLRPDVVVIRRADLARRPSNREGPRVRLLAEGALAAVAEEAVGSVLLEPGKDLAARTPAGNKAGLDKYAAAKLPGKSVEAAAAALAGLV